MRILFLMQNLGVAKAPTKKPGRGASGRVGGAPSSSRTRSPLYIKALIAEEQERQEYLNKKEFWAQQAKAKEILRMQQLAEARERRGKLKAALFAVILGEA